MMIVREESDLRFHWNAEESGVMCTPPMPVIYVVEKRVPVVP